MPQPGSKEEKIQNHSPAYTVSTQQRARKATFQFVDNRPEAVAQRKLQTMVDSSPQVQQLKVFQEMANNKQRNSQSSKNLVIQRTKWEHDGTKWNSTSSSSSDTDTFALPAVAHPNASKGDQYDQQTGIYNSPIKDSLSAISQSSGPLGFYDRRSTTGYKYASGHNRQGPHTLAHITKRVAMKAALDTGREPLDLRGSRAFPRPRVMNKMMRDRFRDRGPMGLIKTRKERTLWLRNYTKKWKGSKLNPTVKGRRKMLGKGMELNPPTVYNIAKGSSTSAEMAGKNESRKTGAVDLLKMIDWSGTIPSTSSFTTLDVSGATPMEQTESLGMVNDLVTFLKTGKAEADPGLSESDSEMDDLDNDSV